MYTLWVTCIFNSPHMRLEAYSIPFHTYGPFTKEDMDNITGICKTFALTENPQADITSGHFYVAGIIPIKDTVPELPSSTNRLEAVE